MVYRIFPVYLQ